MRRVTDLFLQVWDKVKNIKNMGFAKGIKNIFHKKQRKSLGLFVHEDRLAVSLVEMDENGEVDLKLLGSHEIPAGEADWLAKTVSYILAQHGEDIAVFAGTMDGAVIEKSFPQLKPKELKKACQLEVESWQLEGKYKFQYHSNGAAVKIGVLTEGQYQQLLDYWQDVPVQGFVQIGAEEAREIDRIDEDIEYEEKAPCFEEKIALCIAQYGLFRKCIYHPVIPDFLVKWNWWRCSVAVVCVDLLLAASVMGMLGMEAHAMDKELAGEQHQLQLLQDVNIAQRELSDTIAIVERKEIKMGNVANQEQRKLGSIMPSLSEAMNNGVWLTGFSVDRDRNVVLQGKALDNSSLTRMINIINKDNPVFGRTELSLNADMDRDGTISFRVHGRL